MSCSDLNICHAINRFLEFNIDLFPKLSLKVSADAPRQGEHLAASKNEDL